MRKPTQQQLGRRLAEFRKRAKLTQGAVAEKLGVADETLSRIERGAQWTDFKTLLALCELYGVEWADLLPASARRDSARERTLLRLFDMLRDFPMADIELVQGLAREVANRRRRGKGRGD